MLSLSAAAFALTTGALLLMLGYHHQLKHRVRQKAPAVSFTKAKSLETNTGKHI